MCVGKTVSYCLKPAISTKLLSRKKSRCWNGGSLNATRWGWKVSDGGRGIQTHAGRGNEPIRWTWYDRGYVKQLAGQLAIKGS